VLLLCKVIKEKEHPFRPQQREFFMFQVLFFAARTSAFALLLYGYVVDHTSGSETKVLTVAASQLGWYIVLGNCLLFFTVSLKIATRRKAALTRLTTTLAKRDEELLNGWIPMPPWVAIFEMRLAAAMVHHDVSLKLLFRRCSVEYMRRFLGGVVLNEAAPGSIVTDGGSGCYVPCNLILLRCLLQDSLTHPIDGSEPLRIAVQFSSMFAKTTHARVSRMFIAFLMGLPFLIEHLILGHPADDYGRLPVSLALLCIGCSFALLYR
jgi:hypothetical protein